MEKKLFIDRDPTHSNEHNDENPDVAVFELNVGIVKKIVQMQQLVIDNDLSEVCAYDCRVRWLSGVDPADFTCESIEKLDEEHESIRTDLDRLEVDQSTWHFHSSHKFCDDVFSTEYMPIDALADEFGIPRAVRPEKSKAA